MRRYVVGVASSCLSGHTITHDVSTSALPIPGICISCSYPASYALPSFGNSMAPRKGETGIERASRLRATYTDLINKECYNRVCDVLRLNPAELRDVENGLRNKGLLERL